MTESMLQQQLDELRELARRARNLFGHNPVEPPALGPDTAVAGWRSCARSTSAGPARSADGVSPAAALISISDLHDRLQVGHLGGRSTARARVSASVRKAASPSSTLCRYPPTEPSGTSPDRWGGRRRTPDRVRSSEILGDGAQPGGGVGVVLLPGQGGMVESVGEVLVCGGLLFVADPTLFERFGSGGAELGEDRPERLRLAMMAALSAGAARSCSAVNRCPACGMAQFLRRHIRVLRHA